MRVLVALSLLFACGDNSPEPYTWGDAMSGVISGWCEELQACGRADSTCYAHTYHHACELEQTCDVEIAPEVEELVLACVDAMADEECIPLLYRLPLECYDIWESKPS